jgi:hypothetical protein
VEAFFRHLATDRWKRATQFPDTALSRIEAAISEESGTIADRCALRSRPRLPPARVLKGLRARGALEGVQPTLVWDTEEELRRSRLSAARRSRR